MEILMKLKCSPTSAAAAPTHSAIKVVDHHHQLQQHTLTGQPRSEIGPTLLPPSAATATVVSQNEIMLPPCMEYTTTVNCCNAVTPQQCELQWAQQQRRNANRNVPDYVNSCYNNNTGYCSGGVPYETPVCCAGITVGYGMHTPPPSLPALTQMTSIMNAGPLNTLAVPDDFHTSYEYHEPEENFVSIDDAKIKGFLMKIGQESANQQAEKRHNAECIRKRKRTTITTTNAVDEKPLVYEIIELDDEEEREKLNRIKNEVEQKSSNRTPAVQTVLQLTPSPARTINSPDIRLIPKSPEKSGTATPSAKVRATATLTAKATEEKIIAQIDLLDSSDSETNDNVFVVAASEVDDDDEEELPLAAAAVSCELQCDDDDVADAENVIARDIIVLNSDDDFIDEREEGLELRWDDLEEQKERTFFECFLCGKKVQSSYNLRRHMMIHTGERPFGCDMCVRRFREFSDLKKHRRRHASEPNFVCMVCRVNVPTENDPTRCNNCDSKTGVILAATRPQVTTSPEKSHTPPSTMVATTTPIKKNPPSRNITPAPGITPPPPPPLTLHISGKIISPAPNNSTASIPPLTPITSGNGSSNCQSTDAHQLLDHVPAVHRPSYNPMGMITRKEFPCPLCQRPFGTRHNLKRHFMIHTGEKPFNCSKCRKPFREFSTLKKHMVTHQRERWYKCLRCPYKYHDYLEYMEHKRLHPHDEITPSSSSSSSNTSILKKKIKSKQNAGFDDCYESNDDDSSSEDWIECCECGQRFTDIETYTDHLKEHDPSVYLYECYICKKTFGEREQVVRHISAHSQKTHDIDGPNKKPKPNAQSDCM